MIPKEILINYVSLNSKILPAKSCAQCHPLGPAQTGETPEFDYRPLDLLIFKERGFFMREETYVSALNCKCAEILWENGMHVFFRKMNA